MSYYPKPDSIGRNKIIVELDLSNYITKFDIKNVTGVDPVSHCSNENENKNEKNYKRVILIIFFVIIFFMRKVSKIFVYEPTFSTLDLKENKSTEHIIAWKLKVLFKSRLESLYKFFSPNIK